jgi:mRNA interferase MazF
MASKKGGASPARGDVWMVNLDPTIGHEQAGSRPALIVSDDAFNASPIDLVVVVPITGTLRGIPTHIPIDPPEGGLVKRSVVLSEQPRTISKQRLIRRLGTVTLPTMRRVEECLRLVLAL